VPQTPRGFSSDSEGDSTSNLDVALDGKRFAVLTMPEAAGGEKGSVHVTSLLNFLDELRGRIPAGKQI
jgi:hypothetical protein